MKQGTWRGAGTVGVVGTVLGLTLSCAGRYRFVQAERPGTCEPGTQPAIVGFEGENLTPAWNCLPRCGPHQEYITTAQDHWTQIFPHCAALCSPGWRRTSYLSSEEPNCAPVGGGVGARSVGAQTAEEDTSGDDAVSVDARTTVPGTVADVEGWWLACMTKVDLRYRACQRNNNCQVFSARDKFEPEAEACNERGGSLLDDVLWGSLDVAGCRNAHGSAEYGMKCRAIEIYRHHSIFGDNYVESKNAAAIDAAGWHRTLKNRWGHAATADETLAFASCRSLLRAEASCTDLVSMKLEGKLSPEGLQEVSGVLLEAEPALDEARWATALRECRSLQVSTDCDGLENLVAMTPRDRHALEARRLLAQTAKVRQSLRIRESVARAALSASRSQSASGGTAGQGTPQLESQTRDAESARQQERADDERKRQAQEDDRKREEDARSTRARNECTERCWQQLTPCNSGCSTTDLACRNRCDAAAQDCQRQCEAR